MPLPVDVVVAEVAESAVATVKAIAEVAADDMILDIGQDRRAVRRVAEDLEDHPVERSGRDVRVLVRRGHPYLGQRRSH